jgi:hypothetical protein
MENVKLPYTKNSASSERFSGRFHILFLCLLAFCLITAGQAAYAFEWPSAEAKQALNFGAPDYGLPALGISFAANVESGGNVFSADTGEVIFSVTESDYARQIPSTLGAWVACDHGEGMIGIYARGEEGRENAVIKKAGPDTALLKAGKSGWSNVNGFYFSMYDKKERRWVNPLIIVGELPDTISPSIDSVKLRGDNGQLHDISANRTIRQGRYKIEVEARDRAESATDSIAPNRIYCILNGVEAGVLALEIFSARDGKLMIYGNGLLPVDEVYGQGTALRAAQDVWFTRGQASLEIIVQDFNGNARRVSYRLFVE